MYRRIRELREDNDLLQEDLAKYLNCTQVAGDKKVKYKDQLWSLTGLAKELLHTDMALAGPRFFKYNGEWLNDIRHRHETV